MWGRYAAIFGVLGAAWYGQLVLGATHLGASLVLAMVLGLCCAMVRRAPTPRARAPRTDTQHARRGCGGGRRRADRPDSDARQLALFDHALANRVVAAGHDARLFQRLLVRHVARPALVAAAAEAHTHGMVRVRRYLVWLYQHMVGHHPYTNVDGADPDIDTSTALRAPLPPTFPLAWLMAQTGRV
jgi:hypothetical protein